ALVSYRDIGMALRGGAYAPLDWMGIASGEGPIAVAACCVFGVAIAYVLGLRYWKDALDHFDRRICRPCRENALASPYLGRGSEGARPQSPLAEPNPAV